jgi:SAM-dependent methyltransferase
MRIQEISPNNHKGSWSNDLILRKLWALVELKKIKDSFDTVYILGSWYGNASILLSLLEKHFSFDHIVNVDLDKNALQKGQSISRKLGIDDKIEPMAADANELDYRQLGKDGLVINFSAVDIKGSDWLKNIPTGTLVLIQGRDQVKGGFDSVEELQTEFPLSQVFYAGSRRFQDPETKFNSFLIIGKK